MMAPAGDLDYHMYIPVSDYHIRDMNRYTDLLAFCIHCNNSNPMRADCRLYNNHMDMFCKVYSIDKETDYILDIFLELRWLRCRNAHHRGHEDTKWTCCCYMFPEHKQ